MRYLMCFKKSTFFTCITPNIKQSAVRFKVPLKVVSSSFVTMEARAPLVSEPVWQQLQQYFNTNKNDINLQKLFAADPNRFKTFR